MALSLKTTVWVGLCISALLCGNQIRHTNRNSPKSPENSLDQPFWRNPIRSGGNGTLMVLRQFNDSLKSSTHADGKSTKPIAKLQRSPLGFTLVGNGASAGGILSDKNADQKREKQNLGVSGGLRGGPWLRGDKKSNSLLIGNGTIDQKWNREKNNATTSEILPGSPKNISMEVGDGNNNSSKLQSRWNPTLVSQQGNLTLEVENKWKGKVPKIPHIIHQTWDNPLVPDMFSAWMQTWTRNHPHWEYWFWTQNDVRLFLARFYPGFLREYDSYEKDIYRANAMRFYVLYHFGGVYADLDLESLKPMDEWTFTEDCILPEETHAHPLVLRQQERANAMITLLACKPRHPFFKLAIDMLPTYKAMEYETKLLYIDTVYEKYLTQHEQQKTGERLKLVHPDYFLPTFDEGWTALIRSICQTSSILPKSQREVCETLAKDDFKNVPKAKSYTTHHWIHVVMLSDTWKTKNTRTIRSIMPSHKDLQTYLRSL